MGPRRQRNYNDDWANDAEDDPWSDPHVAGTMNLILTTAPDKLQDQLWSGVRLVNDDDY